LIVALFLGAFVDRITALKTVAGVALLWTLQNQPTIVECILDATRGAELDAAALNACTACYLPAPKLIRQFLKEWKYPNAFLGVEHFLHPGLSELHLMLSGLKGEAL
jgi:hypothetical protein